MPETELRGKVALVTGGGRGLGRAVCQVLARQGAVVLPADVDEGSAEATLSELGGKGVALGFDVADERQVEEAIGRVQEDYGRLDVLVNNAGVDVTVPVSTLSVQDWDRVLAVNLRGPFLLSKHALRMMQAQGSGHIVNVVSTAAKRAWANASAYHASKWGLLGLSHALHVEARQHGVKVTAVVSGGMRTPFLLDRFPELDPGLLQDPANVAETIRFVLCQPGETVIPEVMVLPMRETSWP
ncbi:MAG: SDR family oxidoreductase [Actinomycetota bacterium]|nr:SDR family oxidoreductase [Actinomycetota bacterium]